MTLIQDKYDIVFVLMAHGVNGTWVYTCIAIPTALTIHSKQILPENSFNIFLTIDQWVDHSGLT